ncbi:DUF637 domain-containing protein [Xenophilus arseniciresistens]|uniref:DUF637 domain-containing protein n=1 Tax=Xenophilus arseniciresistens TaxID=1283306 RepID=A0AAE3N6E3_9BURK|nr:DUF637 domain-containing protein [Xenophilus arseniciresistens]MDA7416440.1 DUF637 domain-containing protein [Xenophilus arseniciresistens]
MATQGISLKTGALLNDAGLIQSGGALTLDTQGQALSNTNAAGYANGQGGITSADTLVLNAGAVTNTAGYIGAKGAITANTQQFSNTAGGQVFSQEALSVDTNGAAYDNTGGQTQAMGGLTLAAGSIHNDGGLMRSLQTTTLSAGDILNAHTLGTDQGIEGKSVALTVGHLDNGAGAIRADADTTVTSGGTLNNADGLISAGHTLAILDPNRANPAAKTLAVVNTGGTLEAGKRVVVDAARFSGDGTLVSNQDLTVALSQDVTNNAEVIANGNLSYGTTGKLTNNGKLLAGQTLTVSGDGVTNTASGEMSGKNTTINADTLTNRGLIDSASTTRVNASIVNNIGTGRIYGDTVAIGTGQLNNDAETVNGITSAGAIAGRWSVELGASEINNREHALVFSAGEMQIGGALDSSGYATGTGNTLNNLSATIESLGSMSIAMGQVNNIDTHVQLGPQVVTTDSQTYYVTLNGTVWQKLDANGNVVTWGDPAKRILYHRNSDGSIIVAGIGYADWYVNTRTTTDTAVNADPARIVAGGDLAINGHLLNRDSRVVAGGALTTTSVDNQELQGQQTVAETLRVAWTYSPRLSDPAPVPLFFFNPPTTKAISVGAYEYVDHANGIGGYAIGPAAVGSTGATATRVGSVSSGSRNPAIVEVASQVSGVASSSGTGAGTASGATGASSTSPGGVIPVMVRTSSPSISIPQASLFHTVSGGHYLVETDPRFANYRNWLSSDYLLESLGVSPDSLLKRLGDGFYEQQLIREQVAQLTGYRYLDGHYSDEGQYKALMSAGVTFAREFHLKPGVALTADQMAQLTSDIVWLVEQMVTLPDGSTQKALVPQVYVRLKKGDIDGHGALLSADALVIQNEAGQGNLTNQGGTLAGRTVVSITADTVNNLGGRISGGSVGVTARDDVNNLGGTIDARDAMNLSAGRDLNVRTTTQTGALGTANVDRIAGLYVTKPGGTLVASAGNDVNLMGAVVANQGKNGYTAISAGNDINLGTVQSKTLTVGVGGGMSGVMTAARETGTTITTNGTTVLDAKRDVNARQASVEAGDGLLSVRAGRDINIQEGHAETTAKFQGESTSKSLLKKNTTTMSGESQTDTSIGSSFTGDIVALNAENNVNIQGSNISGTQGVLISAGNDLNVTAARSTSDVSMEINRSTQGITLTGGGTVPMTGPIKKGSGSNANLQSDTAVASSITSSQGGVLLQGGNLVYLQGAQVNAAKDITIAGANVVIEAATNTSSVTSGTSSKNLNFASETTWRDLSTGINAKRNEQIAVEDSTLTRTTLDGANVNIAAAGTLYMSGTTVHTPGQLKLDADTLVLATQTSEREVKVTGEGRDVMYQKVQNKGMHGQTTHYNQFNTGSLAINASRIQAGLNARDSIDQLAQQPGMGWVSQLQSDPKYAGKIDWQRVNEVHRTWDYGAQGLTPEGAIIATVVTVYLTAGTASNLGTAAGNSAGSSFAGGTVATLGEGGFIAAGGVTASTVVSGAVTAGITALAGQAAVAVINNQGDLAGALRDLGSSANVRNLLSAIVTGGVLGGMNLNPTGLPTSGAGAQPFFTQLGQNLQAAAARAVVHSAINGGGLEQALGDAIKGAVLDTAAAQAAHGIGNLVQDGQLNAFTQAVAHAIAGCAVGAARADSTGACAAGALGAAVGELAASAYGRQPDTVAFASMISGLAVAIAGGDASQINLGAQAGANAAANNYLNHDQWKQLANRLADCRSKPTGCSASEEQQLRTEFQRTSDEQDRALRAACASAGSQLCRTLLDEANLGTQAQLQLAASGHIPNYYLAGSDFNNNVRLVQQRVDAYDIVAACAANPAQCDQQRLDGAMRLAVTGVSLAALTAFSVELGAVGAGMLAEGAGAYCAVRAQQCLNLVTGLAEMVSGVPYAGVSAAGSWASKVPAGYQRFDGMSGLPPRTMAVVDSATGEVRLLTSNGRIVDVPPAPLPPWSSAADNGNVRIVWGQGIQEQGMPWESFLAGQMPAGSQLPPGFKTFDFYDLSTQTAISAKTLDTMTSARIGSPSQVYSTIKGYVDEVAGFTEASLGATFVQRSMISTSELRLAVPASTTPGQWAQIQRAIEYGQTQGVNVLVTGVR